MSSENERWLNAVRDQLDVDTRDLDATTASRLNRARQQALDDGLRRRRHSPWLWSGLATAMVLVLTLAVMVRTPAPPALPTPVAADQAAEDFEMLAGTEDLELIENLEFYAWLEQQSLDG